ncbi:MAG: BglG family transcription antiterminator [Bacillota bacterium]|nr:BglG family transcription antiterminator [Bacillota bacterium]
MYISARERQILEILLTEESELTVKELAEKIGVSGRTIHRDLKNVEDILSDYQLALQKKSGVGIQLTGEKEKIHELELFLFNHSYKEYTPDERQTMIFCSLLESDGPVKLLGLANDLNVTIATISNDLTKLEERLQKFGLILIRRRGYGVEIEGQEGAKRQAMRNIISEHLDESEILSIAKESIQRRSTQQINTISERLLGLVEKKKLLIVEKVIDSISQEFPFSMADSAYIGLVVHLALAVERIQKGEGITIDLSYLESHQTTKEYRLAEKIVQQLEEVFQIQIPEAEIGYITMHLKGAKLRHDNEYLMETDSLEAVVKTKSLIRYIGNQLGKDLSSNRSLFEGLVLHLKPTLYRLKQNMGISNPLLEKIKNDYNDLFMLTKQACIHVFKECKVPDEEIGYLVMHFGAAVLGYRDVEDIKTLVICSSGIGTSKMLATRLQKEFPEMREIRNVSVMEFKKMDIHEYQLIISTIPIPEYHLDYILVSPILTNEEIERIRTYLHEKFQLKSVQKKSDISIKNIANKKSSLKLVEEMKIIQEYTQSISIVLKDFKISAFNGSVSIDDVLTSACQRLYDMKKIDNIQEVVLSIKEREKLSGLGIPSTEMALFHTRTDHILEPSFTISVLPKPIKVLGMDQEFINMKHLVLLLSPQRTSDQTLEVLSFLSTLLIESEESIADFQSMDEETIVSFLAARFDQFFNEKLLELRSV